MKQIKRLLSIFVVLYLIALVFVYVKQRSFIYFPESSAPPAEFVSALGLEIAEVDVAGVGKIQSFHKPALNERPTILFFHGNGGSVYHRTSLLNKFDEWGVGYLAVEYPGYADNPGKPSEKTIFASAIAHYDWLKAQGVLSDTIIIYGHSLGAASAVHVASERDATGLVLTAPFISAKAMGKHRMPYFPTGPLLKDQFRSDLKISFVDEPAVILHGDKDQVIPHHMGKALSVLYQGPIDFITMRDAGHMITVELMNSYLKHAIFKHVSVVAQ